MQAHCVLPAEFTIYGAADLHRQLTALAADDTITECLVDGAAVSELDACGIQLLLALEQSLSAKGRSLRVTSATGPLAAGLRLIGAGHLAQESAA